MERYPRLLGLHKTLKPIELPEDPAPPNRQVYAKAKSIFRLVVGTWLAALLVAIPATVIFGSTSPPAPWGTRILAWSGALAAVILLVRLVQRRSSRPSMGR